MNRRLLEHGMVMKKSGWESMAINEKNWYDKTNRRSFPREMMVVGDQEALTAKTFVG